EDCGVAMGPSELAAVVGLDVVMSVGRVFFKSDAEVPSVLSTRYAQKRLGKKTGQGFYTWQGDKPQKPPTDGHRAPDDLQDRLMLPLINEAVAVLRENIVEDADLIDAGTIFGAGFAPFRGGPIHYARDRGVDAIVARLEQLREVHGERFTPDAGWQLLRSDFHPNSQPSGHFSRDITRETPHFSVSGAWKVCATIIRSRADTGPQSILVRGVSWKASRSTLACCAISPRSMA